MGILCENIRRRANQEDDCKGHFFENRFKCRECTDESALLLCGIYVDLNPYRAGEADYPLSSPCASIFQRMQSQSLRRNASGRPDGWMSELTLQPERSTDEVLASCSRTGRRASDLGILPISLTSYAQLLTWTGQLLRSGERTTIPQDLAAVLERFEVDQEQWLDTVAEYDSTFGHAVGHAETLGVVAERMELHHMKGTPACRDQFT